VIGFTRLYFLRGFLSHAFPSGTVLAMLPQPTISAADVTARFRSVRKEDVAF
jgi:hypothetical protein